MSLSNKAQSILMHVFEATVVVALALTIAHYYPEHSGEAFGIAFMVLSGLAKGARISDSIPVKDYVNDPIGEGKDSK